MKFAQFLTTLREQKHLSKKGLSDEIGVKPEYIIGIEKGRTRPPTPDRCEQISKALRLSDSEKKKLFELAYEERQSQKDIAFQEAIGEPSSKPIEVKNVKIPVVSMAKGTDIGGFEFQQLEPHEYEYIDFTGCKAVRIRGSSMAPLAYDGQRVIYSEKDVVRDGDLVFIAIKGKGQFFKRYHKDATNSIVTLLSINIANHGPLNTKTKDIEFMYKVVGVKF